MYNFNNTLSSEGLQSFIEWVFTAPDEELDLLQVDTMLTSEQMRTQVQEAYLSQIEEFKQAHASFADVQRAMTTIVDGVADVFEELKGFSEQEFSMSKRKALMAFFDLVRNMAQQVLDNYPKEDAEIFIELVHPNAVVPEYKNLLDAGADVYSPEEYTIEPGATVKIATGFKVSIPNDWKLSVRPRSGLSLNTKMRIANAPGTIEPNYLDEVGVIVDNIGDKPIVIMAGERPCQLVLERRYTAKYTVVSNVADYASGNRGGGFGHTGK